MIWSVLFPPFFIIHKLNQYVPTLEAADAKKIYTEEYKTWREDPANFFIDGRYPIRDLWGDARDVWKEILLTPVRSSCYCILQFCKYWFGSNIWGFYVIHQGESFLVVTQIYIESINLHCLRSRTREVSTCWCCNFKFPIILSALSERCTSDLIFSDFS